MTCPPLGLETQRKMPRLCPPLEQLAVATCSSVWCKDPGPAARPAGGREADVAALGAERGLPASHRCRVCSLPVPLGPRSTDSEFQGWGWGGGPGPGPRKGLALSPHSRTQGTHPTMRGLIQWSGAAREGERPGGERDSSRGWGRARRREETEVAAAAAARQP